MKANELRIGNYIQDYYNTKIFVVKTVDSTLEYLDLSDGKTHSNHITNLKPIPLTEDILLKCGFLLSTPNQYIKHQHWYNETTDIEFNHLLMCSIYEGNGHVGVSHVKYLHQLQNLHYALTGQELAIKM